MRALFFTLILCAFIEGCAPTFEMKPQALSGQEEVYQEGIGAIGSAKNALVILRPLTNTYSSEDRPTLVVSVLNRTEQAFDFSTDDIEVFIDGVPHRIFTYEELVAEIEQQELWAAVAVGISGAAQTYGAANSAYSYQADTANAHAYSYNGSNPNEYGSNSGYTYNAAAAQQTQAAANAQTQAGMQAIAIQTEQSLNLLSSTILKKATVFPQAWHGGYVIIAEIPNSAQPHEIRVIISAAGEPHEFLLQHVEVEH